ncbi:MAG: VRR-NUC domain-containing protein [Clostridiales bacterium]|nr:VRR-NUC domain-containing protein [Clostridiales bacterium]
MRESTLVYQVIRGLYGVVHLMRANVGSVKTEDGRRFSTGLPKGFPDLFGVLPPENSATGQPVPVFIECKVGNGRPSPEQKEFIRKYRDMGCCAGVVWSLNGAWDLILPFLKVRYEDDEGHEIAAGAEQKTDG